MKSTKLRVIKATLRQSINDPDRIPWVSPHIIASHSRMVAQLESRYNLPMDRTAAEILEQARKLPPSEINWLIGELLQEGDGSSEAEIEASWKSEVERRVADADAGNGSTCSWEEVQVPLRARLRK